MKILSKSILLTVAFIQTIHCAAIPEVPKEEVKPKVSMILPVYNSEKYINRTIESLMNQTLKDIEIVVVDDASKDKSLEILREYEKKDPRVRIIHLEQNKGISNARNVGMDNAKADFIGFMDSDDYMDNRYIENLYKYAEKSDVVVGKMVDSTNLSDDYIPYNYPLIHGYVWNSLWRKSFIFDNKVRFNVKISINEDKIFRKEVYDKNPILHMAEEEGIYYYYKRREGSLRNFKTGYINSFNEKTKEYTKENQKPQKQEQQQKEQQPQPQPQKQDQKEKAKSKRNFY